MLAKARSKLTYANLMATIAVFIALGGGAYAVGTSNTKVVKKVVRQLAPGLSVGHAITADSATSAKHANAADSVSGKCPSGMVKATPDLCSDISSRTTTTWSGAMSTCSNVGLRLPDPGEAVLSDPPGAGAVEWTSDSGGPDGDAITLNYAGVLGVIVKSTLLDVRCVSTPTTG